MTALTRFISRLFSTKRPFKLTRGGWVFILYTIGVGAGAINTGNNLLYLVFGIFLGLILASGVLSDVNLWRVAAAWQFPEAAEAGQPCALQLRFTNKKEWMSSVSLTAAIEGQMGEQVVTHHLFVPSVAPKSLSARELVFTPARRGYYELRSIRLFTQFPFGLLQKRWTLTNENKSDPGFFIFPQMVGWTLNDLLRSSADLGDSSILPLKGEGSVIGGLRSFAPGDHPRRIHWRASARRGSLDESPTPWFVRETERDAKRDLILHWPDKNLLMKHAGRLEDFISFTASLIRSGEAEGHQVQLVWEGRALLEPLKFLAIVQPLDPVSSPRMAQILFSPPVRTDPNAVEINLVNGFSDWTTRHE